ncbi:MAG: YigZ family protein [Muribaculaceae bacterium]|nr:YigZ family protein [Muribaculaceae bacterium]
MTDLYRTIIAPSEASVTDKRSRFMAFAYPVASVDEVKIHLAELQKKYFDARHICWAYMLGPKRSEFRANDNGEPSGTAGKPILGQINSFDLTDIMIAVVRYFGGIKLGTSGLIAAYRQAAREAIEEAVIVERHEMRIVSFTYPYMVMNDVMKLAHSDGCEAVDSTFDNLCSMTLRIEAAKEQSLRSRLGDIDGVQFQE